jgi:hypothetical protein
LAKETIRDRIVQDIIQKSGGQRDEASVMAEADRLADIELKVQKGYLESKGLGYKPTAYQQLEEFVQKHPPSPVAAGVQSVKASGPAFDYLTSGWVFDLSGQKTSDAVDDARKASKARTLVKRRTANNNYVGFSGGW